MFELYAAERYSAPRLQAYLTDRGLRIRKGNRVMVSSIHEILKNPFYYGDFIWADKHYQGNHQPIIDQDLFDRVQAVNSSKNRPPRHSKHSFAYTGLLKCATCGCSITAEIRKGRYVYYHLTFGKGR